MKVVKMCCLAALSATSFALEAANADVKRIEIEKESSVEFESCEGIGSEGLILISKDKENQKGTKKGHDRLTFTKYDTLLNKVKTVDAEFTHDKNTIIVNFDNQEFRSLSKNNNLYKLSLEKSGEYEVLFLDGKTMNTSVYTGEVGKKSKLGICQVMGDYVYMSGSQKGLPFVYSLNVRTGAGKMTDFSVAKNGFSIMSFETDDEQNEVHLFMKERLEKGGYKVKLYVFVDGTLKNEMTLAPDADSKYMATAFASKMQDGSYIISGTYSDKDNKVASSSIGVFLQKVEQGKTVSSSYINYLDLKNFTSYMTERQLKKMEKKKEKKAQKNEEYAINYNMLPYRVIEKDGKYLLVGEAYYPTYATRPVYTTVSNGKGGSTTVTTYQTVFDGWAYSHYFVLEFDQQCKMEWSNAATMQVQKTWIPRRHMALYKTNQALEMFYPSYDNMNHVSYSYAGEEQMKEQIPYVGDEVKLKRYYGLNTEFWYDGTFLSYGNLKVKDDEGKHKIYSINRIKCSDK